LDKRVLVGPADMIGITDPVAKTCVDLRLCKSGSLQETLSHVKRKGFEMLVQTLMPRFAAEFKAGQPVKPSPRYFAVKVDHTLISNDLQTMVVYMDNCNFHEHNVPTILQKIEEQFKDYSQLKRISIRLVSPSIDDQTRSEFLSRSLPQTKTFSGVDDVAGSPQPRTVVLDWDTVSVANELSKFFKSSPPAFFDNGKKSSIVAPHLQNSRWPFLIRPQLAASFEQPKIVLLYGHRRVGKTSTPRLLYPNAIYINFLDIMGFRGVVRVADPKQTKAGF